MKMLRLTYRTGVATALLAMLSACGGDHDAQGTAAGEVPLVLTGSIAGQDATRTTDGTATNITNFNNTAINVYLFDGSTAVGDSPMEYTALYDGTMTPPATSGIVCLPDDIDAVSIYGLYPTTAQISGGTVSATVQNSQQALADYQASDLLFAKATASKTEAVGNVITKNLAFNHLMAKIVVNVNLKPNELVLNSIRIANVYRTVTFTPASYTFGSSLTGLTASNKGTTDTPCITILEDASITSAIDNQAALIAPQTFGTVGVETKFIEIITGSGTAWYSFSGDIDFLPGCTYTVNLAVRAGSIGTTTVITTDWIKTTVNSTVNV